MQTRLSAIAILTGAVLAGCLAAVGANAAGGSCGIEIQAHRGVRPFAENGLLAIAGAGKLGYDAAEIDIQPLKDGSWALHHDPVIGRMVAGAPPLSMTVDYSAREWKVLRLRSSHGEAAEAPATFDETIDLANRESIRLAVEIKAPVDCRMTEDALKRADRLKIRPSWHTAFEIPARCLASRKVADLGFVIGPDPERLASTMKDARLRIAATALLSKVRKQAPDADAELTNRKFLTLEGLDRISEVLEGAARKRLILPSTDAATMAWLPDAAARRSLDLVVYAENGNDDALANDIRKMKKKPAAVVADGPRETFCRTN